LAFPGFDSRGILPDGDAATQRAISYDGTQHDPLQPAPVGAACV